MPDLLSAIWSASSMPELSPRQWEDVLVQARVSKLPARLAVLFQDRGWLPRVPASAARHLESAWRMADRLRLDVRAEIEHIADALRDVPTPVVLLKGAAYVGADLPPARGRLFSDLDIMVAKDQLEAVELALMTAGWIPQKLEPYDDRYYRTWMHELPPLQHVERMTLLDVHHTIAPPTSRFAIDGRKLMDRRVGLPGRPGVDMLAPVDMVIHCAVHLMQEGSFNGGMRDLLDLGDLLACFGTSTTFYADLVERARELGVDDLLFHALHQLHRLCPDRVPDALLAESRRFMAGSATRRWMATLLETALHPDHDTCDGPGTGVARWLLYVRSHAVRMPWYQIGPHLMTKSIMKTVHHMRARPAQDVPTADR